MDDAKVSRFYTAVTKMSNGMVQFEIFYKALLDLCDMQNEVILYRSLRILHVVLLHFGGYQCISTIRDNCAIEASNDVSAFGGTEDSEIGCHKHRIADVLYVSDTKPSCIEWFSLFQLMHRISTDATDEPILYEVVSIMNVILKRDGPSKRERYGQITVFQTVPKLFRKEAGFRVRKEAVHLIYLLVNCPTVLASLYSGFRENMPNLTSSDNVAAFEGLSTILAGLEDCLICIGNVLEALELRRNAITLLSYLVSFGTSDHEVLWRSTTCNKTAFLVLIMRLLAFEISSQISNRSDPIDIVKERTLLVREALTFLNRIVSLPAFSGVALRALTATREVASLTIDTSRLSLRCKNICEDDNQILDLACTLYKKVSS